MFGDFELIGVILCSVKSQLSFYEGSTWCSSRLNVSNLSREKGGKPQAAAEALIKVVVMMGLVQDNRG